MKKATYITLITLLVSLFAFNVKGFAQSNTGEETWIKYPDNSGMEFKDVDSFYDSLDKKQYVEFKNAKLSIREKVNFKDINTVLSKADKYGKSRHGGDGFHPKRQVYVFVTVSQDGKKMKTAIFDAERERLISASSD